ncbi:hypothetical protein HU200_022397 [Digitaria exilis]|uniref:AB hydrolase-1 domain-containing protein n=1 Tax=Digitaria exilis TaxID=1010633 RepID=A0A835EYJ1_9POAL|nr:hypothetical protein HU200_022397 [Digitaria exilis]
MAPEIEHAHLPIRGLNIHVAQVGKDEQGTVVFLHGFPEIWYSWRHQMLAVAAAGYRAIAPDCRGYGLSDQPPEHEEASWDDLVADVLAILDAYSIPKVAFLVAKDFGAKPAYELALRHPERTRGVTCLGVPFSPVPFAFDTMPEGFYILRWRVRDLDQLPTHRSSFCAGGVEPGRAEADFGRYDVRRVVRTIYVLFSGAEIPTAKEGQEIMDLADLSTPLPEWFTEEDLDAYANLYEKSGFRYPLQIPYRAIDKIPNQQDAKFQVPVFMVMGEKDYSFKFPEFETALRSGAMENFMLDLKITFIPEGSHFVQEQFPEQVNELLLGFLKDHPVVAAPYHRWAVDPDPTIEGLLTQTLPKNLKHISLCPSSSKQAAAMAPEIEHTHIPIRGLNIHVAQIGKGVSRVLCCLGTVVFLHGFPEIWYSWRHQMLAVATAGYRAIAPDCRGYGLSDQPPEHEEASWDDLVADVLAILDAYSIPKVAFLVAKDFGAKTAYELALRHPERTCGVTCLGTPFNPKPKPLDAMPEGLYIQRWREPGRAEADFGRYDVRRVVRTIYVLFSGAEIPVAEEGQEIMDLADLSTPLPEWFTEEDLDVYAKLYEKSGFRYPLQMPYRATHKMPDRQDAKFQVPVLMVMGEKDYSSKFPGFQTALRSGAMESFMPDLKITFVPEGSHFVQEQFPEQVNGLLLSFLKDHPVAACRRDRAPRRSSNPHLPLPRREGVVILLSPLTYLPQVQFISARMGACPELGHDPMEGHDGSFPTDARPVSATMAMESPSDVLACLHANLVVNPAAPWIYIGHPSSNNNTRLVAPPPRPGAAAQVAMAQEIEHTHLPIRGINIHVAQCSLMAWVMGVVVSLGFPVADELGTVVFLHGFPEIWYSWRHQMLAVAAAGYRAIAPDWRGYGLSDQPPENEEASWVWDDLVADVLAILDALSVPKAFLVAKDFGVVPAYEFALRHPERTRGVTCLGIPFSPVPFSFEDTMPEGFYILRWGEPGRAEADFGRYDVRRVVRTIYVLFSGAEIPTAKEGQEIMDLADLSTPLPEWFTEEDLDVYTKLYEKSGFRYPLQMPYRSVHKMPNRLDAKFQAPVFMVMGEKDYCFKFPGFEAALRGGAMENFMPDLKITFVPEGSHFVQEQLPEQVDELLLGFFKDHPVRCGLIFSSPSLAGTAPNERVWLWNQLRARILLPKESENLTVKYEAMDMDQQFEHRHLPILGLNLHVAQAGKGDKGTVVFLHGFPEIWYSWRHQMLAVAAAGYRAVAPDWRGYGLSDEPPVEEGVVYDDLLDDLLGILDALSIPKAFLVGKDFGAVATYDFALRHPDRVCGVMCLGIPFSPFTATFPNMPEGFYMYDVRRVVRTIYILFSSSEIPIAKEDQEITDLADLSTPLPEWFSEKDLAVYASLYEKSGFREAIENPKFQVPVFVVMGDKDYVNKLPGFETLLKGGIMAMFAPDLKIAFVPEGSHFVQEQFPDKVNEFLIGFLKDHSVPAFARKRAGSGQQG